MSDCMRCQGKGAIKVPALGSTQHEPIWTTSVCPVCFGMGWAPRKRPPRKPNGYFAVHSERASHLPMEEIMKELGL